MDKKVKKFILIKSNKKHAFALFKKVRVFYMRCVQMLWNYENVILNFVDPCGFHNPCADRYTNNASRIGRASSSPVDVGVRSQLGRLQLNQPQCRSNNSRILRKTG